MKLTQQRPAPKPKAYTDDSGVSPGHDVTVWDDRRVVLYTHDEKPLVRKTGFAK